MAGGLEVADVFRRHGPRWRAEQAGHLDRMQRRVIGAIEACRTAALGGHLRRCADCGHAEIAYNSCRDRHCPKCQGHARAAWVAARCAELLPVPYFHVVFTLPAPVGAIAFQNKATVYAILFRAAAETLRVIAADPRHLGAEIGGVSVLHSWGQAMQHHPHVHCIVPAGGLSPDRARWIGCPPGFFLSVKVLGRLFRRLFLERLAGAFAAGGLRFSGDLAPLAETDAFAAHCALLRRIDWVVYAKRPFGGPEQVLAYLGRYTHRVAIANSRLLGMADGKVSFRWKDHRDGRQKVMTLDAGGSCAGSCFMSCRPASTASATSASSPTAIAPPGSPSAVASSPRLLPRRAKRAPPSLPPHRRRPPRARLASARAAAACRSSAPRCRARRLPRADDAPSRPHRADPRPAPAVAARRPARHACAQRRITRRTALRSGALTRLARRRRLRRASNTDQDRPNHHDRRFLRSSRLPARATSPIAPDPPRSRSIQLL